MRRNDVGSADRAPTPDGLDSSTYRRVKLQQTGIREAIVIAGCFIGTWRVNAALDQLCNKMPALSGEPAARPHKHSKLKKLLTLVNAGPVFLAQARDLVFQLQLATL